MYPELRARLNRFGKHGAQRMTKKATHKLFGSNGKNVLRAYVQSMDQMREVAKELDNETTSSTIAEEDHTPRNALANFRRSGNKVKTQLSVQRKMKGLVQGARASTSTDFMDPRHTTGDSTSTGWTNPGSPNHPSMRVLGTAAMFAAGPSDTYHKPETDLQRQVDRLEEKVDTMHKDTSAQLKEIKEMLSRTANDLRSRTSARS